MKKEANYLTSNLSAWQEFQDAFAYAHAIYLQTFDRQGKPFGKASNINRLCQRILNNSAPEECQKCGYPLGFHSSLPIQVSEKRCSLNLVTLILPIIFRRSLIGYLSAGRVFSSSPIKKHFLPFSQRTGFDFDKLSKEIEYVPVISRREVKSLAKKFLSDMIELLELSEDNNRINKGVFQSLVRYEIEQIMMSILDIKKLSDFILHLAMLKVKGETGSLMILDESKMELTVAAAHGLEGELVEDVGLKLDEESISWLTKNRKPLCLVGSAADLRFKILEVPKKSKSSLFLTIQNVNHSFPLGVININRVKSEKPFGQAELKLLSQFLKLTALPIKNAKLMSRMENRAITDGLTGTFNQSYFFQRLNEEIKRATRYNDELSLAILDLDSFKLINDTYGHQMGDRVLQLAAKILKSHLREIDTLARYGGDEFAVIAPRTSIEGMITILRRVGRLIEEHIFNQCRQVRFPVTVSAGIANFPAHAENAQGLFRAADQALLKAKRSGKSKISVYA